MMIYSSLTFIWLFAIASSILFPAIPSWFDHAKIGIMVHWGPVSQWGAELSWPLFCDPPHFSIKLPCTAQGPGGVMNVSIGSEHQLDSHRRAYWRLAKSWDPINFNASNWASLMETMGARYMVYTAVHADGFCGWNSKYSNFTVTKVSPHKRDIVASLSSALHARNLYFAAYYAKSHWGHPDYWKTYEWENTSSFPYTAFGNSTNYDTSVEVSRWKRYQDYVKNQILELVSPPYSADMLWFDHGYVKGPKEELNIYEIYQQVKSLNPELVFSNRGGLPTDSTVQGEQGGGKGFSVDWLGPEGIPGAMNLKWEGIDSLGNQWAYLPNDKWKNARQLIHAMLSVVSKGGNYLLDVGPRDDGTFHPDQLGPLKNMGDWLKINGEAIYGKNPAYPYCHTTTEKSYTHLTNSTFVTRVFFLTKSARALYVILRSDDDVLPSKIVIPWLQSPVITEPIVSIYMLGSSLPVPFETVRNHGIKILPHLPKPDNLKYAFTFKLTF